MNSITLFFLLLGCYLVKSQSTACEELHSPASYIKESLSASYISKTFCRIIRVPTGKFIQLKMVNMSSVRDCHRSRLKIYTLEKDEPYLFCGRSRDTTFITALSDVTVDFLEREVTELYEFGLKSDFYLEYVVKDIECINAGSFKCSNISCIPQAEVCDGIQDCENGLDEIGCETGVLTIEGVVAARRKAVSWLKQERNSLKGWRDYTPRAVVALYLASDATFNGTVLEEELMAKDTEIKVAVALLRPSLTNSDLSMFIHALLVTCHDPRDFHGNDLVKRLKEQVVQCEKVPHPISYLALCNAHESWPERAEADLKSILNSTLKYPFMKDLQAMAILALSCKFNSSGSTDGSLTSSISRLYKHTSENLHRFQAEDGSFGNLHSTALITQALISSGQENSKDWKMNATLQYMMKELNSPFIDFLSVYLSLPILNGKSLKDISKVNCSGNPRKNDIDALSEMSEYLGPKMRVQYTLQIGDESDVVHTISLRVPENYTAFQIMQLAEVEDHKYKFEWKVMSGNMYVFKIANILNDPETGKFWLMFVRPSKESITVTHHTSGPDEVVLNDGQELIFWFKTASI